MAISMSGILQAQASKKAYKDLHEQHKRQQAKETKRKGWSGVLGGLGGAALGAGLVGLTGLSGGLAAPLLLGLGKSFGKKWVDEATKGGGEGSIARKLFGKKGLGGLGYDPKVSTKSKFGYGKETAQDITKSLGEQRKTQFSGETLLTDIASSYLSAGASGKLGGAKSLLKGDVGFGEALTGQKDWAGGIASGEIGGLKGMGQELFNLLPGEGDAEDVITDPEKALTEEQLSTSAFVPGGEGAMESVETNLPIAQENFQTDWQGDAVSEELDLYGSSEEMPYYAEGGIVSNKAPTIADYFGTQGVSMGGSSKLSLAQILGR